MEQMVEVVGMGSEGERWEFRGSIISGEVLKLSECCQGTTVVPFSDALNPLLYSWIVSCFNFKSLWIKASAK